VLEGKSYRSTQPVPKLQTATSEKVQKTAEKTTPKGGEKA
jgi:hypothetical protein